MALTKRIIPCLDIKDGQTVKGIQFENIRTLGDPIELAAYYTEQGADELVFLDITATHEKRKTLTALVKQVAACINIPFTVGGGISSVDDVYNLLHAGADKISINSAAVKNPALITQLAKQYGSQCVVVAIDTKYENDNWYVYINGGRITTTLLLTDWVEKSVALGAGELLITSINHDGSKQGYANDMLRTITHMVHVPVIASGGAGTMQHFADAFAYGAADAALAAGMFHSRAIEIPALKQFLKTQNIPIRI